MKRLGGIFLVVAAFQADAALTQFQPGMTQAQLQQSVQTEVTGGKSIAQIAKAMLDAKVPADAVTTAMILAGLDPATVAQAVINAGGEAVQVINAALAAGVSSSVVTSAAKAAGVNATLVAIPWRPSPRASRPGPAGGRVLRAVATPAAVVALAAGAETGSEKEVRKGPMNTNISIRPLLGGLQPADPGQCRLFISWCCWHSAGSRSTSTVVLRNQISFPNLITWVS